MNQEAITNCCSRMERMQNYGTDKWNRGEEKMKPIIINMDEMSDSREVYESKPGKAGLIFLYSTLALVVAAVIWMVFGKMDEVVKSEGIIRPNSDISTVVNQTDGEITEVNVEDGKAVQKGDCLYQVDCSTQVTQKDYLEQKIEDLSDKKHCLEVYKRSVKADTNLLADTGDEEEYHIQFESYFISYQNAIHSADYTTKANQYQTESNQKQLLKKRSRLSYYEKLKDSIAQSRNLFTDSGEESEFYTMYQKYVSGYQKIQQQYDTQKQEISASTTSAGLVNTIAYYTEQKEGLVTLIKSVKRGKDCFTGTSSYQLQYEQYESKMEQLQQEYETALEDYNLNFDLQEYGISESELAESETKADNAKKAITDYKTSYLAELRKQLTEVNKNLTDYKNQKNGQLSKSELLKNNENLRQNDLNTYAADYKTSLNSTITEIEAVISNLEDSINSLKLEKTKTYKYSDDKDSTVSSLKINELKTTMENITSCESQIDELKSQLETVQFQIDNANVTAAIDGIVNSNIDLVAGDVLAAGTQVMTIIPLEDSAYKVNIYVANRNIGKLKKGMKVKLSLDALPNSEYGYLTGTITSISEDIKANSENTYGYYLVEATVENKNLYDKNGEEAKLKSGMSGQAKIIVGEKSIFRYVMEKLNLWVNS